MILRPRFVGNYVGHGVDQSSVPRRSQTDGLREDGGHASLRHAVQALIAPVVSGNSEALNGGRIVNQLRHLFFQSQPRNEVIDAHGDGQARVAKGNFRFTLAWTPGRDKNQPRERNENQRD